MGIELGFWANAQLLGIQGFQTDLLKHLHHNRNIWKGWATRSRTGSPKPVWILPVLLKIPAVQLIAPTELVTPTFCSNICARLDKTKCHICCWFFRIRNCCTQCLWELSKTIDRCCEKRIVNKLLQVLWELSENAPPACSCLPSPCSPSLPAQHWCKVGKSQADDGNSFAKGTASSPPLDPLFLF